MSRQLSASGFIDKISTALKTDRQRLQMFCSKHVSPVYGLQYIAQNQFGLYWNIYTQHRGEHETDKRPDQTYQIVQLTKHYARKSEAVFHTPAKECCSTKGGQLICNTLRMWLQTIQGSALPHRAVGSLRRPCLLCRVPDVRCRVQHRFNGIPHLKVYLSLL